MAQVLTVTQIPESEAGMQTYMINWSIPNWRDVRKSESLVNCQEAVFETNSSPSSWFKTKWRVGLKLVRGGDSGRKVRVYWKLLEIYGSPSNKVEAKLLTLLSNIRMSPILRFFDEKIREVKELEIVEGTSHCLQFNPEFWYTDEEFVCPRGNVKYVLKLTLKTPIMSPTESYNYKMGQFSKTSVKQLQRDQEALLYNSETGDLNIFTSDGVEIMAHKAILTARCPVFAAMLNCDLSENATGIIRMIDITGKTMKLLLHYFYTGKLLPSWRDPDTIVEFTYAAGKYQVTRVLELLDDTLGMYFGGDASNLDVQLINLVEKMELRNAEARLMERIVAKISKVTTGAELFELFGYEKEEIAEMAEKLATEQVGESKILKLMDSLYDSIDSKDLYAQGMPLLAFVQREEMKKLEKNLLKRFADVAEFMGNSKKLLTLFCREKQMGN